MHAMIRSQSEIRSETRRGLTYYSNIITLCKPDRIHAN